MTHDEHEQAAPAARPISSIRSAALDHYRSLLVAVQFLTRLPTPTVAMGDEAERRLILGRSAAYFPLVVRADRGHDRRDHPAGRAILADRPRGRDRPGIRGRC